MCLQGKVHWLITTEHFYTKDLECDFYENLMIDISKSLFSLAPA